MASEGGISTDRGVQTAKPNPDGSRADYVIKGSPGLRLRVMADNPAPKKVWSLLYRRKSDGKRVRITIGEYPALTLKSAKDEAGRLRSQARTGSDPAAERQREAKVLTVAGLADRYIEIHAMPRKRSWENDARILRHDIPPTLATHSLSDVTKRDIIKIRDTIFDRGATYQSNRVMSLASKLFAFAVAEDLLVANPCIGIPKRGIEKQRKRPMSADEIRTFWASLPQSKMTEPLQIALKLALLMGVRINEIAGARKNEFDLTAKLWTIPGTRIIPGKRKEGGTKNRRDHTLPLTGFSIDLIEKAFELSGRSAFLFPSPLAPAKPIGETAISRGWRRSRGSADSLQDLRVHDLRHTFSTGLGDLGFHPFQIDIRLFECFLHGVARFSGCETRGN